VSGSGSWRRFTTGVEQQDDGTYRRTQADKFQHAQLMSRLLIIPPVVTPDGNAKDLHFRSLLIHEESLQIAGLAERRLRRNPPSIRERER
jgi:hypothetical protein